MDGNILIKQKKTQHVGNTFQLTFTHNHISRIYIRMKVVKKHQFHHIGSVINEFKTSAVCFCGYYRLERLQLCFPPFEILVTLLPADKEARFYFKKILRRRRTSARCTEYSFVYVVYKNNYIGVRMCK